MRHRKKKTPLFSRPSHLPQSRWEKSCVQVKLIFLLGILPPMKRLSPNLDVTASSTRGKTRPECEQASERAELGREPRIKEVLAAWSNFPTSAVHFLEKLSIERGIRKFVNPQGLSRRSEFGHEKSLELGTGKGNIVSIKKSKERYFQRKGIKKRLVVEKSSIDT